MSATILIVDDMADNRLLLDALLSDKYTIQLAESGQQCLDMVSEKNRI